MNNVLIIHHDDPDGRLAGFIMYQYYLKFGYTNIKTLEAHYDMEFDFNKLIDKSYRVCIVDFSLNHGQWADLLKVIPDYMITWIDHHKSAIESYTEVSNLDGIRHIGLAGCELSYLYANGWRRSSNGLMYDETRIVEDSNSDDRFVDINNIYIPLYVKLVGDYDCWRKQLRDSEPLIIGINSIWDKLKLSDPNGIKLWKRYMEDNSYANELINNGKVIRTYIDAQYKRIMESRSFEVKLHKFEQYKCIAVNTDAPNSWIFNTVFDKYHIGIPFRYYEKDGKKFMTFSLYRLGLEPDKDIDCSKIAQSYGGGGHPGASGFSTHGTLPFEK